jgi:hypothetical protein
MPETLNRDFDQAFALAKDQGLTERDRSCFKTLWEMYGAVYSDQIRPLVELAEKMRGPEGQSGPVQGPAIALSSEPEKGKPDPDRVAQALAELESLNPHMKGSSLLRKTAEGIASAPDPEPMRYRGETLVRADGSIEGLDDDEIELHNEVQSLARARTTDFWTAFAAVTAGTEIKPGRLVDEISHLADQLAIDFSSARSVKALNDEIAEVEQDTGKSLIPFLSWAPLSQPPEPWNSDHFERDKLRASAAGIDLDHATWKAHAENGRDVVGEAAAQNRTNKLDNLRRKRDNIIARAQLAEANKRRKAIAHELDRRAHERLNRL